jgi:hypothetical protein
MIRYCLETGADAAMIHRVDCPSYDLGTLLGLGCVADLGEYKSARQALEVTRVMQPGAVLCKDCCKAEVMYLPQVWQPVWRKAITLPSG